ncbi:unnamed protein product [Spirodela intermedia]|uniref:Uncharacterized protein n=1 Tax=Spirodela intermedia TaxID=51605 RepID=A0A7I8JZM4_SPIIN|nr:unnamed protein product [Spirodela intermedia]
MHSPATCLLLKHIEHGVL